MRHGLAISSAVLLLGLGCATHRPIHEATDQATDLAAFPPADTALDPHPGASPPARASPVAEPSGALLADTAVDGQVRGVVRGLVIDVHTVGSGRVERLVSLDLRDEGGAAWTFSVQGNPGITGAHAREHRDRREPVTVTYVHAANGLIALKADD
jgi:hypothetical protein